MSAWKEIKEILIVNTAPGTVGRQRKLILAADIFIRLLPYFKNEEKEKESCNTDNELREALLNRPALEGLKDTMGMR